MSQQMSREEMIALLAKMQAENESLKSAVAMGSGLKVSEKGAVSLYGVGKFPVTLYRSQWEAILTKAPQIRAFIDANASLLATKG